MEQNEIKIPFIISVLQIFTMKLLWFFALYLVIVVLTANAENITDTDFQYNQTISVNQLYENDTESTTAIFTDNPNQRFTNERLSSSTESTLNVTSFEEIIYKEPEGTILFPTGISEELFHYISLDEGNLIELTYEKKCPESKIRIGNGKIKNKKELNIKNKNVIYSTESSLWIGYTWSEGCNQQIISYQQVKRDHILTLCEEDKMTLQPNIAQERPNTVSSWHIFPSSKWDYSIINVTVEYLNLDESKGDYVLIGSTSTKFGNLSDVFRGPPPLLLTGEVSKPKTVAITTDSAYVVFVSKSTNRKPQSFKISYIRSGKSSPVTSTEYPYRDLWEEAVPICVKGNFSNIQDEEKLKTFCSMFDSSVTKLIKQYMKDNQLSLSISEENIIRFQCLERKDDHRFYVLLTVTDPNDKKKPLFLYDKLANILYKKRIDDCQLDDCAPPAERDIQVLVYVSLGLLVLTISLIVIWRLKYNSDWKSKIRRNKDTKVMPSLQIEMHPKEYNNPIYEPDTPVTSDVNTTQFTFQDPGKRENSSAEPEEEKGVVITDETNRLPTPFSTRRFKPIFSVSFAPIPERLNQIEEDNDLDDNILNNPPTYEKYEQSDYYCTKL